MSFASNISCVGQQEKIKYLNKCHIFFISSVSTGQGFKTGKGMTETNLTEKTVALKDKSCVIVVENLPLPFDRRVWQEANALKEAGWHVSVICPKNDKFPESYVCIDGIHIYRHSLPLEASGKIGFVMEYLAALFHEFRLLIKVYREQGFDVIQACNPPDLIFLVVWPFKLLGKKFIFDHHDICPELFAVKFERKGLLYKTMLFLEKLTYKSANKVITANDTFKNLCGERTGTNADKITSVYSVPDNKNMHRTDPRPELKQGKRLLVGYIGIIGNQDGVDHLVRAMAYLKYTLGITDIRAVIIGDGPDLQTVKALAVDLKVAEDIEFTGYLSGENLMATLSTVDVGVIPDPYNEYNDKISMNKVFEYSKLGVPIVSYSLQETKRLLGDAVELAVTNDDKGLAEAISRLCDDNHRAEMGKNALALAESKFSWEIEKRKYVEVFESLVSDANKA